MKIVVDQATPATMSMDIVFPGVLMDIKGKDARTVSREEIRNHFLLFFLPFCWSITCLCLFKGHHLSLSFYRCIICLCLFTGASLVSAFLPVHHLSLPFYRCITCLCLFTGASYVSALFGPSNTCNNVYGYCLSGCVDGYQGERCENRK